MAPFKLKKTLVAILIAVLAGLGIGYGLWGPGTHPVVDTPQAHDSPEMTAQAEPGHAPPLVGQPHSDHQPVEELLYACPMNCVSPMQQPGTCPVCGMELVAMTAEIHQHRDAPSRIALPPETVRSAGIQTAPVERKIVTAEIRLFGKIDYDPVEQYRVTAFAPGIIDRIYVKRAGQTVRRGDPLFDMHSSELYFLEEELFAVLQQYPDTMDYRPARGQRYKRLMRPARRALLPPPSDEMSREEREALSAAQQKIEQIQRKMMLLGLSKPDIDNVMARGRPTGISTVTTPTTGVVLEQYAFKGTYVNTGETIFTIANTKYIWARLDAYESDVPWIRIGQEAHFETDSFPGEIFKGKVQYLDPYFDPQTRTFRVGVLYTDPKTRLKPNMLVRCVIQARMTAGGVSVPGKNRKEEAPLVIPDTAPLITGSRAVVYVADAHTPGVYEGREVTLGPRAKGYYVIQSGLQPGEEVVVNGSFKIDSAVQILAQPSMMEPQGGRRPPAPHHQHGEPRAGEMKSPGA